MVDFKREREWWNSKADREETDLADEAVNRALRWRELERHLDGVRTVLDVGGGTGAFSIPLARRGYQVTHVDFAPNMIAAARHKAAALDNISFVEANAVDLSQFQDQAFDLVLNMDGAISFCGAEAAHALAETCRVARRTVIVAVTHRANLVPVIVAECLLKHGYWMDALDAWWERGHWHFDEYPDNPALAGAAYMGTLYGFMPAELRARLTAHGLEVVRCGGLGTLAQMVGLEAVQQAQADSALWAQFIDRCERFDRELLPNGPGTRQRAGLIGVARRL